MQDDCDAATFNAALGPGTCVGEGETTFDDFLAEFQAEGAVDDWEFSREEFGIEQGGTIKVVNEGGEFHSFTKVDQLGNGCIPLLDTGDEPPVADCDTLIGLLPGETETLTVSDAGTSLFQCMIHPWMRSEVEVDVEADDDRG